MEVQRISHYEIREILGEGENAIVYKAWDLLQTRWAAVRLLLEPSDETSFAVSLASASAFASCVHRHVVSIYEVGHDAGQIFLAEEYLPGGTLRSQVQALHAVGHRLDFETILDYAVQIADGLAHLHARGLTHGNLHLDKVFLSDDGVLKIGDFVVDRESSSVSPSFDSHCLALLLYELATGAVPLQVLGDVTEVSQSSEILFQSLARLRPDLPDFFESIVRRLLAEIDRSNLSAVVDDLRKYQADRNSGIVVQGPEPTVAKLRISDDTVHAAKPLSPNQVLAGRFKIIRFLGRGGMGEVYAAEDLELGEQVALKTVLPEIASDERVIARFRKEIQLARKVTHQNVCRIYDLFHHLPADTSKNHRITFLTMELLRGETLAERLRRDGPMDEAKALPVILQMTAALDAAHKAGIVHGDFKTSNVMLVDSGTDIPRVVITDFGLARHSVEHTLTQNKTAGFAGTPAYMAPELFQGGVTTPAVDIYSFGVVAYELLTGKRPFTGSSGFSIAQALREDPASPRTFVPDLDSNWESTILRCLEKDPGNRLRDIAEVPAALSGEIVTPPSSAVARKRRVNIRIGKISWTPPRIGIALVLFIGVLYSALQLPKTFRQPSNSSLRSVAVLGFTNLSGRADAEYLSRALSEMLNTRLAAGEQLRTIPRETIERMKLDLSLNDTGGYAQDTLGKIRDYLNADFIVYGNYIIIDDVVDTIRLELQLQDTSTGEILAATNEQGSTSATLDLVAQAAGQLREQLGLPQLPPAGFEAVRASTLSGTEASRLYAQGWTKLQLFDAFAARELLEKAVANDPKNALASSALAIAWSMLGHPRVAKDEADKALRLASDLPREERLLVEGRYHEAVFDWKRAVEVYETLFGQFPDKLDYGLRLASSQVSAGNTRGAAATIQKLREFPAPENEDPRIDIVHARLAAATSDFKTQQSLAAAAVTKGKSLGARLLVAGGRLLEGSALVSLGELANARAAFQEARTMYIAAGDSWESANAGTNLALVLAESGDLEGARTALEDSLIIYRKVGDQRGTAAALVNLGTVLRNQTLFPEARKAYQEALDLYRKTGDRSGETRALNNLANLAAASGDSAGARKLFQEALPVVRASGDVNATATVLVNLAELLADQGELAEAERSYDQSLAMFRQVDNKSAIAHTLDRIADLLLAKGDLKGARAKYEEALALRNQTGESEGYTELALATLALEEDNPTRAEQIARAVAAQLRKEGRVQEEATALAVLARALFAQGRLPEVRQPIEEARRLADKSNQSVRISVRIVSASMLTAIGGQVEAARELTQLADESQRAGLVRLELQARLALSEVELQSGRRAQGQARLRTVEDAARKRGYLHLAKKAAALRARFTTAS